MINYVLSYKDKKDYVEVLYDNIFKCGKPKRLENIDLFTTSYTDIDTMKVDLFKNGALNLKGMNKDLKITYFYKNATRTVKRGLMFASDKDYLDYNLVMAHVLDIISNYEKLNKLDNLAIDYLRKIINHFQGAYDQTRLNNISTYLRLMEINGGLTSKELKCLLYDVNFLIKGIIVRNEVIQYRGMHDLGAVIRDIDANILPSEYRLNPDIEPTKMVLSKELPGQMEF